MDSAVRTHLENMYSQDRALQTQAYFSLLEATDQPVEWAYEVWDRLVSDLKHKDNHVRSIAAQLLCNLAKSDPQKRILKDFDGLLAVTKDERFVTARHSLQALWKIGAAGEEQREKYLEGLTTRFHESALEKNGTLIRYDIIQSLRKLYIEVNDERLRERALALIEQEGDLKYRKKYASLWRNKEGAR